eukprot:TRINITY_DN122_c0_g3_i1.p1 TRINITY_DN122_c0_g3~~TRINITY_DN122_c0_g3_i1.p1  ORF type:complete len:357 (+),score=47.17 TRINITY_DN122_c0_g3_i1:999-2069(+)
MGLGDISAAVSGLDEVNAGIHSIGAGLSPRLGRGVHFDDYVYGKSPPRPSPFTNLNLNNSPLLGSNHSGSPPPASRQGVPFPGHAFSSPAYGGGRFDTPQLNLAMDSQGTLRIHSNKDTALPMSESLEYSAGDSVPPAGAGLLMHGYATGQQVEAAHPLHIMLHEEKVMVVQGGDIGTVLGPATTGDPGRIAVLFESYVGEPLNVEPSEICVGAKPFDLASRSIETHLARMLWEGRDPYAGPSPRRDDLPPAGEISPMIVTNSPKKKQPAVNQMYRDRLLNMFERYNPHRLPSIPNLLKEYHGCEEALMHSLVKRYGPEPPQKAVTLPPGWSQVQSSKGHVFYRHVNGSRQWTRPT